ncbi:DUF6461 domain-containing protein [Streptomyces sp. NPDC000410]|uniref:DUF6461 domain-containing protein n=1 Tax=Streptomyces sp. NPDC000410 TaxID=3154254 RepID=UPI003320759F
MHPLAWIGEAFDAHCLVLAEGLTGRELLLRLGVDPADLFTPEDEDEANEFLWAGMEDYWNWGAARAGEAGGWAFALEPASLWAASDQRLERASGGTRVLCCWCADGSEDVAYWQDGSLVTRFETLTPHQRSGADPDRLAEAMRRVGLAGDETVHLRHAGLALAHEVTGVVLPREETTLALTGKLPADDEAPRASGSGGGEPPSVGSFDFVGGPVGGAPVVRRVAGKARTTPGAGTSGGAGS